MKNLDNKKNHFTMRITNNETQTFIEDLMQTGLFDSKNELLNKCLDIGILDLAKQYLRHRKFDKTDSPQAKPNHESTNREIQRLLKQVEINTSDMFIILNIHEHLLATLYNIKAEELGGNVVSKFDMINGFNDLPEYLQDIKADVTSRFAKQINKELKKFE